MHLKSPKVGFEFLHAHNRRSGDAWAFGEPEHGFASILHKSGPGSSWWWNFEFGGVKNVVDILWQIFYQFFPRKIGSNFVTETSPHSSLQAKEFVTCNSLWEHSRAKYSNRRYGKSDKSSGSCNATDCQWLPCSTTGKIRLGDLFYPVLTRLAEHLQ